ncbi:hypothetical protein HO173_005984 [Letharia columbiana]|uniref:Uncharacterized protein n=1 Tax=Letharia columbiana TaxID=112416 RepID=A0A8H6L4Y4_9LECA|nr:uncharacterized protein HO173_005984 [Letharia columbiana]KAF6235789.1 hypothetical protein HO173_005984 [Letharia columbiana]
MKLKDGSPDCIEFYSLGQDDMLGTSAPRDNPEVIESDCKTFQNFFCHTYGTTRHLLALLDKHSGLEHGTFAALSLQDKPSGAFSSPTQLPFADSG